MKKFNIEVISKKPEIIDGVSSYWGRITIGNFSERFVIPLDSWNLKTYKTQWQEGIKKIKDNDFSCLITGVMNLKSDYPSIELWSLYKDENNIFFQNNLLIDETMEHSNIKLSDFNPDTCYQYIDHPRQTVTEDGAQISEWNIATKDFFQQV